MGRYPAAFGPSALTDDLDNPVPRDHEIPRIIWAGREVGRIELVPLAGAGLQVVLVHAAAGYELEAGHDLRVLAGIKN